MIIRLTIGDKTLECDDDELFIELCKIVFPTIFNRSLDYIISRESKTRIISENKK